MPWARATSLDLECAEILRLACDAITRPIPACSGAGLEDSSCLSMWANFAVGGDMAYRSTAVVPVGALTLLCSNPASPQVNNGVLQPAHLISSWSQIWNFL